MPYRDEFDDPQTDRNIAQTLDAVRRQVFLKTRGPAVAAGVLFVAALILAGVIFFTYPGNQEPDTIPIIQADARPFKVIPDDPGGMAIPHRDSTVFSSLRSSGIDEGGVENLFDDAETEEPMPRSQLFAGLNMDEDLNEIDPSAGTEELLNEGMEETESLFGEMKEEAEGDFAATRGNLEEAPEPMKKTIEKVELIEPEPIIEESAPVVEPKPAPKPETEPEPQQIAALREEPKVDMVTGSAAGTHYVQIGAVKSAAAAAAGWGTYQKEYSPILSGADHRVQRADLGDKGIYFRIQAGPFSKAQAGEVCSSIKQQKPGGCLVVAK
ncbi:MAG: SPOR domain-containing protein [Pseudomonadota bacterium]